MKELIRLLKRVREEGRWVFVCGNGGSSATAEHLSNDLLTKGVKVLCLNSNNSILTMLGNDYGYQYVFSKQLEVYGNEGDLLITISCSGISQNVVNAIGIAIKKKMSIYQFEHFDLDKDSDYEKLENKHLQLVHKLKKAL